LDRNAFSTQNIKVGALARLLVTSVRFIRLSRDLNVAARRQPEIDDVPHLERSIDRCALAISLGASSFINNLDTTISCSARYPEMTDRAPDPETADKWEVQLRKGCLDLAILAVLWGGKLYGLEILRRLESDSDLVVSDGTVYPLLGRLKDLGLVLAEWEQLETGHPRKYYSLTPAGEKRVRDMAATWTRFSSSMSRLLAPLEGERNDHDKR
jgi:PadR family transcriptional regulator PadR